MISSHTFELTKEVDKDTFYKLRNKVTGKKKYNLETDKHYALVEDGIIVWYHKTEYKYKIKLFVNPNRLLGYDDLVMLWEPKKKNIAKLLIKLEEHIVDYFNSRYELKDFKLTRIDFTVNIRLGNPEKVSAYIKLLYNIKKAKGFSPKYDKNDAWYNENFSFDLEGNSNGIDFTAYDKAAAIKEKMKDKEYKDFKQKEM